MENNQFKKIYESTLVPDLQKLEGTRKILLFFKRLIWVLIGTCILLFIIGVKSSGTPSKIILLSLLALIIFVVLFKIFHNRQVSKFNYNFKEQVVKPILHIVNPSLIFEHKGKVSKEEFIYSRICDPLLMNSMGKDVYKGEDLVHGEIDNAKIRFSDLDYKTVEEYEEKNDETGKYETKTREYQIYSGQFFVVEFPFKFKCSLLVIPEKLEHYYGGIGTTFQQWGITKDSLVKTDDFFTKHFATYTNNENSFADILTDEFRKIMVDFSLLNEHDLLVTINDNKLHFALRGMDSFEPNLKESILDFEKMNEFYLELGFATKMAKSLLYNTRCSD